MLRTLEFDQQLKILQTPQFTEFLLLSKFRPTFSCLYLLDLL